MSWLHFAQRQLPTFVLTAVTALFAANDTLNLVSDGRLDVWAFPLAFVLFVAIVVRRIHVLEQGLEEEQATLMMTAEIGSFAANLPDPGPDKTSMTVRIFWEIWVVEDVSTNRLALNVIYVYDRPWWRFWRQARLPVTGIPGGAIGSTTYRRKLQAASAQPYAEDDEFTYITNRHEDGDPHWLLELVLETGHPTRKYRVPVSLPSFEEMSARRVRPPL